MREENRIIQIAQDDKIYSYIKYRISAVKDGRKVRG